MLPNIIEILIFHFSQFTESTTATTFLKDNLRAYISYEFRVIAINSYGETNSEWTTARTLQNGYYFYYYYYY